MYADLDDGRRHEYVRLARAERMHHARFLRLLHLPVQFADARFGQLLFEFGIDCIHAWAFDGVALLDRWTNDVALHAFFCLLCNVAIHILALACADHTGLDWLPSRRQLVDH